MPNKIKPVRTNKQPTSSKQQHSNDIKHLAEENQRIDDQSVIYVGPNGSSICEWAEVVAVVPHVIMYAKQSHNKLTT